MAVTEQYEIGDLVRLGNHTGGTREAFKDAAAVAMDPTTVTLTVRRPDGTLLVYAWPTPGVGQSALTKEAAQTGRFYADVAMTAWGRWGAMLAGTGAVETAYQWQWDVVPSYVAP